MNAQLILLVTLILAPFASLMARGVNEGWLDASFADTARHGWKALQTKVTPDGDLLDVCGSTDTGDLAFYLKRPRLQGDLHGFGSYLLAGAEIVRMQTTHPLKYPTTP
jgi:rhamnogalacturonyl hydrolase YesR